MKFEEFPKNFLLIALFIVCIVAFAIGLAGNYNLDSTSVIDNRIPHESIKKQVNDTSKDSEKWKESIVESDSPLESALASGYIVLKSIFGVISLVFGSIILIFNLIMVMTQDVLGIPPIVTGTFMALLIMSLIFALWRVLKGSE